MRHHPAWRSPLHAIRDALSFSTSASRTRTPSFMILDALQQAHPAVQMDALFLTAVAMAQTLNLDPHEMVARAKRQLPDAEGPFTEHLQAARDYARGELKQYA